MVLTRGNPGKGRREGEIHHIIFPKKLSSCAGKYNTSASELVGEFPFGMVVRREREGRGLLLG